MPADVPGEPCNRRVYSKMVISNSCSRAAGLHECWKSVNSTEVPPTHKVRASWHGTGDDWRYAWAWGECANEHAAVPKTSLHLLPQWIKQKLINLVVPRSENDGLSCPLIPKSLLLSERLNRLLSIAETFLHTLRRRGWGGGISYSSLP